ncbi:MAG: hypothetical protein OEY79_01605, partial [Anaplasmataceae bacterium]|nr:hypothetical protein [Anaplasmataceae bacterium]
SKNDLNKKKNICFVRYKEYKDIGKCLNDNLYNNHVMQSIKLKTPIKKITKKKKYHFNIQQSLAKKNINKDTNNILSKYKIDREKNTNKDGGTVTTFAKININKIEKSKLNTSCFLNYKNLKKIGKCLTYKIYYPKISHIFLSNKTIITNKMNENHINKNFYKNKDS